MKSFSTSILIHASPDSIGAIQTDAPRWLAWNPTIEKVEGAIVPGGRIKVFTKIIPGRAFSVRVTEFVPRYRMVWTGGMPFGCSKALEPIHSRRSRKTEWSSR
jgi:hypothetical protein